MDSNLSKLYKEVFDTPAGQQVLTDICNTAGLHKSSFCPGDPYQTAYIEGFKAAATHILNLIHKTPQEMIVSRIKTNNNQRINNV